MKLELDISDDLWKRIEVAAEIAHKTPQEYLRGLVDQIMDQLLLRLPHPEGARGLLQEFLDTADPNAPDDFDEFARAIDEARGEGRKLFPPEKKGTTW